MASRQASYLLSMAEVYFTIGLIFFLSAAAVGFMANAVIKAIISTWACESAHTDLNSGYTRTVAKIAVVLALQIQVLSIAATFLDPFDPDASLTYCIAASTASLAALSLAATLATTVCVKTRSLLDHPIDFMAHNCLILTYFVSTGEEARRCATVIVSIITALVFAWIVLRFDKVTTSTGSTYYHG